MATAKVTTATDLAELFRIERIKAHTRKRKMQLHVMWSGIFWLYPTDNQWEYTDVFGDWFRDLKTWMFANTKSGSIRTVADLERLAKKAGGYDKKKAPWKFISDFGQPSLDRIEELVKKYG